MKITILALSSLLASAAAVQARTVSTPEARQEYMRRGQVWQKVDVASMDTLNGPSGEGAYRLGEEVPCTYEEKDPAKPIGGHSKKFPCHDAAGVRLKIKYDPSTNKEIFGEVAGSRLFWALGFYAERMYSVKVLCKNCPQDPFKSSDGPRAERVFEPATSQKRLPGEQVVEGYDDGWTFDELAVVDEKAGGASKAQLDALKLLAVFANHGDNTPNQQRILCVPGDGRCLRPLLYVTDLGGTFGGEGFSTSFRGWSKKSAIWKDKKRCVADFRGTTDQFRDPKIGEAGRKPLPQALGAPGPRQIRNLFAGARFDVLDETEPPLAGKDGRSRKVTLDDWVRVFLDKREQIASAKCPE